MGNCGSTLVDLRGGEISSTGDILVTSSVLTTIRHRAQVRSNLDFWFEYVC